ncbi:MAG: hypothetical protein QOC92_3516, partial [Acidimicrobiaceae bacterium]
GHESDLVQVLTNGITHVTAFNANYGCVIPNP